MAAIERTGLAGVLLLALAVRLWTLATHTYIAFPDETFQYLEPAHRLAFGSGVVTWEFIDGIRSWLLPGVLAGLMRLVAWIDPDPRAYVTTIRLACVLASLAVPYVGYRIVARHCGVGPAIIAGLLCALSPPAIYFAPVILIEPLAADVALLAIWVGDGAVRYPNASRRLLLAGALFGLASAMRYQYAPALAVVALWQHARDRRAFLRVALAGSAVVVLVLGGLDTVTWGTPFQSVWLNYIRNGPQGVSTAMGTETWSYYFQYYLVAWGPLTPLLLACFAYGAMRVPALAIAAVCTIALHMLAPHKEVRFVFLATACIPMVIGAGLGAVARRMPNPRWGSLPVAVGLGLAVALATGAITIRYATRLDDWHRDRSLLQATAAARAIPGVCGLAIRGIPVYRTGGYSYWHRDAPIYFETWEQMQTLKHSAFRLRLRSVLDGKPVPQYPDAALAAHTDRFNVMIGTRAEGLPGFTERECHGPGVPGDPEFCVFTRPGGCG